MSHPLLRSAIERHRALSAHYQNYVRYFCPYRLGVDKNGTPMVVVFQYDGGRRGGLAPEGEWSTWRVEDLHDLRFVADGWHCGAVADAPDLHRVEMSAQP
jgi:hypothetical protein